MSLLVAEGIDSQIASDFLAIRKAKRAPLTTTALDGIKREAAKAVITLEDALRICIERGWQGFKADWYKAKPHDVGMTLSERNAEAMRQGGKILFGEDYEPE